MATDLRPIPTMFNGRTYRSRLEANVAQMLYQLGIAFAYEPISFLLDDGTHYRPDFWCRDIRLWIEVRGYSSPKADRQIRQFGAAIMDARVHDDMRMDAPAKVRDCGHPISEGCPDDCLEEASWRSNGCVDYLVLSPGDVSRFFEVPSYHTAQGRDTSVIVCRCHCGATFFASMHNDWRCRVCFASDKHNHLEAYDRLFLDGYGRPTVEYEWHTPGTQRWGRVDLSVPEWLKKIGPSL